MAHRALLSNGSISDADVSEIQLALGLRGLAFIEQQPVNAPRRLLKSHAAEAV
ncbi:hypothetical protein D3C72_2249330 [compost metagenome]